MQFCLINEMFSMFTHFCKRMVYYYSKLECNYTVFNKIMNSGLAVQDIIYHFSWTGLFEKLILIYYIQNF